jgi:hypothetical protein
MANNSSATFTVTPAGGTPTQQTVTNNCSSVLPVTITPAAVVPAEVVDGPDVAGATLPATGSGRVLADLELGFGLILLGASLMLVSRRRRSADRSAGRHFLRAS